MTLTDKQGREIKVGTYVIYPTTGTIGEVLEIKQEDNTTWVLLQYDELTRLWYNTDYLEVTDKRYKKEKEDNPQSETLEDEILEEQLDKSFAQELSDDAVGGG